MDSEVTVYELQNDCSVKKREAPLMFRGVNKSRLLIVTNQKTQLRFLNNSIRSPRTEEGGDTWNAFQEKSIFRHGASIKVFAVTDPTGTEWEVRLLLSPSEISRLSSNFNLTGFVSACLTSETYQESLSSIYGHQTRHEDVEELSMAATQFISCSEDNKVNDYQKKLNRILIEKLGASCLGQENMKDMVVGALVVLVAAELATSVAGTRNFDYKVEKEKTQEDQSKQVQEIINIFDVTASLLTVSHRGKRVQIIFRNPCPDNWASGGKKLVKSGETFVFGLCHKVVSIYEAQSEIQFLQNLQESYDLVSVFHLPAFVEHLLMTSAWRKKIELFLKEQNQRKEIINELSSLAVRFVCSKTCQKEAFMKELQREMVEKWSSVEAFLVGDEVVCAFGILVAILAAVTAKSMVGRRIPDSEEVEDPEEPTSLDDSSYEIITTVIVENDGAQPDLGSSIIVKNRVQFKNGVVGICGAESSIDDPNVLRTDNQGSIYIHGSSNTAEPLAEPPGVSTPDTADQEIEKSNDDADENFGKYPDSKDNAHQSGPTSGEDEGTLHSQDSSGGPSLDDSNDDDRGEQPSVEVRDNAHESGPTSGEDEGTLHSQDSSGGPSLDDSNDDDRGEQPSVEVRDNAHESGPTSGEDEGTLHSQDSSRGPSLDDSNDDDRGEQPSVVVRDNAPETEDSSFLNTIFNTSFVAMLIPVLLAITLGLLIVKWQATLGSSAP
ncbi:uncharacterized protein LOC142665314 [Rhinoderma darwinii]|uniref:uncharacterized protein LOC142665314 n=1 Tax=Rhinoderma darwinii TaxID=43563 RepID=UPI003F66AB3D